jgi:hypothetical protein
MRPLVGAADSRPAAPNSVNRSADYSAAPVQIDRPTGDDLQAPAERLSRRRLPWWFVELAGAWFVRTN